LAVPKKTNIPRVVLAALKGGAGKTFLTVGLTAALKRRGLSLSVFKKGPDYIDAGWLGLAAGGDCYNLDAYLCQKDAILESFLTRSLGTDIAVVEGNRGLFDGMDSRGSYSSAEMAKLLKAPVILIVDATKMTRTAAALVLGCTALDPEVHIQGVILNRVAGPRHERILRESIEGYAGVPVIGSVAKLPMKSFPQRHLGLLPLHEHPDAMKFVEEAAGVAEVCIDIDKVLDIARTAEELGGPASITTPDELQARDGSPLKIGVLKDSAFQFYYPENLEALTRKGARLMAISALESKEIPDLDALYVGGGFPETHADTLADNTIFKESLFEAIGHGLPVYAECGGLMYLSRNLCVDDNVYPMVGVFPVDTVLQKTPQGHGYARVEVSGPNPFYEEGTVITGHEFHYSYVTGLDEARTKCAFKVLRGHGIDGSRDGLCTENVLAAYIHVHALGEPRWASGIIERAARFRSTRLSKRDEKLRS
jgi:cobyrinic acid a,c-diamide synthase